MHEDRTQSTDDSARIVRGAIDTLLEVVGKSAEDLVAVRGRFAQARLAALPPFPRETVVTIERIVDDLKRVERDLRDLLVALGISSEV
jgi:hypothetical protein